MAPHPSRVDLADPELDGPESASAGRSVGWRLFLVAALGPVVTGYAAVAALLALVTATAANANFATSGVLLAAGPGWLAAFQVPLDIAGGQLGMLPLLPTIGMVLLVACTTAGVAGRAFAPALPGSVLMVLTVVLAHAGLGAALSLTLARAGSPVTAAVLPGTCFPAALSGVASVIGLVFRRAPAAGLLARIPASVRAGMRAGLRGLALLVVAGAVLLVAGVATSLTLARDLLGHGAPEPGSAFGLVVLSVGYLPNGVVGGMSFLAGPGLSIGDFSAGPLRYVPGDVPGVPLLAALPEAQQSWWPALLLVPLAVGAYLGWSLRSAGATSWTWLGAVGVAGLVVAAGCLVLCAGAGGRLADGPFDPVTLHPWRTALAGLGWITLPGAAVVGSVTAIRAGRARFRRTTT